jgi:hypothetical protein
MVSMLSRGSAIAIDIADASLTQMCPKFDGTCREG